MRLTNTFGTITKLRLGTFVPILLWAFELSGPLAPEVNCTGCSKAADQMSSISTTRFRSSRPQPIMPAGNWGCQSSRHSTITGFSVRQAPSFATAKCAKTASTKTAGRPCGTPVTGNPGVPAQQWQPCSLFITGTVRGRIWLTAILPFLSSRGQSSSRLGCLLRRSL